MKALEATRRPVTVALLAIFALATLAPLAEAGDGRGRHRRYKGPAYRTRVVERVYVPARRSVHYYHRGDSGAAPLLAGLIGGFILGAATTRASGEQYVYWDPSCERTYRSFDDCREHWGCHSGIKVLYQVERRSGRCVDAWRYADGGWHRWDGNPSGWDDEDGFDRTQEREQHRDYGDD